MNKLMMLTVLTAAVSAVPGSAFAGASIVRPIVDINSASVFDPVVDQTPPVDTPSGPVASQPVIIKGAAINGVRVKDCEPGEVRTSDGRCILEMFARPRNNSVHVMGDGSVHNFTDGSVHPRFASPAATRPSSHAVSGSSAR